MAKHRLKFRTAEHCLPPRPIRLEIPGWAGDDRRPTDGATPQPWHCKPFVDGSTYGLELLYPYGCDCRVENVDGEIRFRWDPSQEKGLTGGEFSCFAPGHYGFNTGLDLQVPTDCVLRIEPHPRFFTDRTGTVPLPIIGNLQTEWWPKMFFVAFVGPSSGGYHLFRKGEPYCQVIVVPRRAEYSIEPMSPEEAEARQRLETWMAAGEAHLSEHSWTDHSGQTFNDRYKVLSRIYHTGGADAVRERIENAYQRIASAAPEGLSEDDLLARARTFLKRCQYAEARHACYEVLGRVPTHGEALALLASIVMGMGRPMMAVECLVTAVKAHPQSPSYRGALGVAWLAAGQPKQAVAELTRARQMQPTSVEFAANLSEALFQAGRADEALSAAREAASLNPQDARGSFRQGAILERLGRLGEALAAYRHADGVQSGIPAVQEAITRLKQSGIV